MSLGRPFFAFDLDADSHRATGRKAAHCRGLGPLWIPRVREGARSEHDARVTAGMRALDIARRGLDERKTGRDVSGGAP